jgi:hypothetical protein
LKENIMLIGELITRLEDEAIAAETLIGLGDVALLADVSAAAADQSVTLGEFTVMSVERFATHAADEEWLTMIGRLSRTSDPGAAFLRQVLAAAVRTDEALARPAMDRRTKH